MAIIRIDVSDNDGMLNAMDETTATGGSAAITVFDTTTGGDMMNTVRRRHATFGYNEPNSISGTVWSDGNSDGSQRSGGDGSGRDTGGRCTKMTAVTVVATTTTQSGRQLQLRQPAAGRLCGGGDRSANGRIPRRATRMAARPRWDNKTTTPITLTNGESVPNVDFGYNDPALSNVSGTVFYDVDTDGTYEPDGNDGTPGNADDESGIGAVTLTLSPTYSIVDGLVVDIMVMVITVPITALSRATRTVQR